MYQTFPYPVNCHVFFLILPENRESTNMFHFCLQHFLLQVGEYQPSFAATACHPCEPGTSSRGNTGSQACSPCEPGQEAVVNGSERCIPCKRGFYSEAMAWAQQKSWRIEKNDIPRHLQRKRSIIREPLKVRWFMMV